MKKEGFMDPVARAEAEIAAMMGKSATPADPTPADGGNPGIDPAPANPDPTGGNADPMPADPAPNPTDPPKTETPEYWRQRFEVMQGKYNAEVPRLVEQVNALMQQVQESAQAGKKEDPPAKNPASVEEALAGLYETYGSDLTDALDRLVQARVQKVEEKVSKVETATAQTAKEKFYGHLDRVAPDWRVLNTDPGFFAFLATPEEFTGIPFQALLASAFESGDAERTAKIFNTYSKTINPTSTPETPKEVQPTPDALATPAKRGGGDPGPAPQGGKKTYTMAEVNAFYKDLELGRYNGKEQEAARIENDILIANQEGRIRG
jgi:hypothetical protein